MFTQNIDADREILLKIDSDKELLDLCIMNKYTVKLCDNNFFYNRLMKKYPEFIESTVNSTMGSVSEPKNWKQQYLKIVYYVSKLKELGYPRFDAEGYYYILKNNRFALAILRGDLETVKKIYRDKNRQFHMMLIGGEDANEFFINPDEYMSMAIEFGQKDIMDFFIKKGANDWDLGIYSATHIPKPNMETIIYFIKKRGRKNSALKGAAGGGHIKLVKFFIEKGAEDITRALVSAVLEYDRIDQPGYEEDDVKSSSIIGEEGTLKSRLMEVIHYLTSIGASVDHALIVSVKKLNYDLINYFIASSQATRYGYEVARDEAKEIGNEKLAKFFQEKIDNF